MSKKHKPLRRFCKVCGTRTYHNRTKYPNIISCIKCGNRRLLIKPKDL